ncbi:TIGR01457 family HAD-type hydrolase [Anaerobacillus sp. MEB173]|uniref:TIGR01457 family HAD-type hydrolase n=1 Tax=Anaerobacillus sp. MEB173 TaxID=3383345 RepID=UPI003F8F6C20
MKKYEGFLIDLDGTMFRGTEVIQEAADFVHQLEERKLSYLYVTNNSSRTREEVSDKLVQMGIPSTPDHVFTTSIATANYIAEEKEGASVYVIGENGIRTALAEKGLTFQDENPDYVVMGIDRDINYEKLTLACLAVRNGATFISTNGDIALPTERGLLPGNGSLTSVVAVSTGVKPTFIGKPEAVIINQALDVIGTPKEKTLMIGDNYDTDILAGIHANMDTLMVHTGVTSKEQLKTYSKQPTYVLDSLAQWEFE